MPDNLRYWRLLPYIGAGPGRCLTLPAEPVARAFGKPELAERGGALRVSNPRNIQAFLSGRDGLWGAELESISSPDFLLETLMMGLRLEEGISTLQFRGEVWKPLRRNLSRTLEALGGKGSRMACRCGALL